MAAGTVVIIAAAHAARLAHVLDVFRLADATAPARGRTLESLGLAASGAEVAELAKRGILVHDARANTWHLSEAGVVADRTRTNERTARTSRIAAVVAAVVLALLAIVLLVTR